MAGDADEVTADDRGSRPSVAFSEGVATIGHVRPPLLVSALMAVLLWGVLVLVGFSSGLEFPVAAATGTHQAWDALAPIFLTNASAALGLYTGIITAGISTFASSVLLGLFTGAVFHGAVDALGTELAIRTLAPYFVFEGLGLLVATVAGFIPVSALAMHWFRQEPITWRNSLAAYVAAVQRTLVPLSISLALIAVGSVMEVLGGIPK